MRKLLMAVLTICVLGNFAFADKKADNLMKAVFDNADAITSADVTVESVVTEKRANKTTEKTDLKKILMKKPNKMKITYLDAVGATGSAAINVLNASTLAVSGQNTQIVDKNASLYPECLFNITGFLKDFNLTILDKDERIKRGMEEVIAIKKGQTLQYPQIRIWVKTGRVQEMKFYSISGKKYYSIKINQYDKKKNIDVPVDITEDVIAQKNSISNRIKYTNVDINKTIPDAEFIQ